MRKRFVLALGFSILMGSASKALALVKLGAPVPDFTLSSSEVSDVKLSAQRGKYVVLEWYNPGCPFVRKHYDSGNMQKLQEEYTGKGVVWYQINSSAEGKEGHLTPSQAESDRDQAKVKSTATLLDPDGKVGKLYGAKTTPHMFVLDPEGKLIYSGAIDDKVSTETKDVKGARNYVKEALDAAMNGKMVPLAQTKPYGCSVKYKK